jgi:hypothetical protein
MELIALKNRIVESYKGNDSELMSLLNMFDKDVAVFPFNEYEFLITTLISKGQLTYADYLEIRDEYIRQNPNLWIFEISAPRGFGESFAQSFVRNKSSKLLSPSKKLDENYHGQYDLWYNGIRIEVKASRVVDAESDEPLYRKALSSNTTRPFLMNFQQLKPQCCDVFVWLAVYRDIIKMWVMNSDEVLNHPDYSKGQHRGNSGNEGQLHIRETNIHTLDKYLLKDDDLAQAIYESFMRSK